MNAVVKIDGKPSLIATMAARYGVDQDKMMTTLKATAFRGDVSNEQMMALCIVANQYGLNPWTKEIYAFPDRSGIVPVVGVDGWSRIINEHPQCDGIQFKDVEDGSWIECTIYRKDRQHATTVREYMVEVRRDTAPWKSHPRRMLRHKALIQCARVAFGFAGIYDQDEAERIIDVTPPIQANPRDGLEIGSLDPEQVRAVADERTAIMDADKDETEIALAAFDHDCALPHRFPEMWDAISTAAADLLPAKSRKAWKEFVSMGRKIAERPMA